MGLFDFFKKKDDFLGNQPPDFSQPTSSGMNDPLTGNKDAFGNRGDPPGLSSQDLYGRDPLHDQNRDPLGQDPMGARPSTFDHDLFSTGGNQPGSARDYARTLNQQSQGTNPSGYAGVITGHEAGLILERLDTIKAELDAIKQRAMRIERYIDEEERKALKKRYF